MNISLKNLDMKHKGKTYVISCQRGMNRDNCKFMRQDSQLHCSICSFAAFIERKKQKTEQEEVKTEDGQQ